MGRTWKKLGKAALGFGAGVFLSPLAVVACPFLFAWFLWNESDDDCGVGCDTEVLA